MVPKTIRCFACGDDEYGPWVWFPQDEVYLCEDCDAEGKPTTYHQASVQGLEEYWD